MPVIRISEELFKEVQKYAEPLVDNFETALWKALQSTRKNNVSTHTKYRSHTIVNQTPQKNFWRPILETLVDNGGEAYVQEVVIGIKRKMNNQLKEGDYEVNRDGTTKWEKAVHFQRLAMVHEGLVASNTPRGIWAITDQGRRWLSEHSMTKFGQ